MYLEWLDVYGFFDRTSLPFIQHTSASLLIQENYDPPAKRDLESWLNRLVPENDPLYTHTVEGPDDMPACGEPWRLFVERVTIAPSRTRNEHQTGECQAGGTRAIKLLLQRHRLTL